MKVFSFTARFIFTFLFFPLVQAINNYKSKNTFLIKSFYYFLIIFIVSPLWVFLETLILLTIGAILIFVGIIKIPVPTIGASMMPTIINGSTVYMHPFLNFPYLKSSLSRDDIVVFQNENTEGKSYIKRVVGIPGDKIVLKNGYVYIGKKIQKEPFTLKSRSTFGGKEIKECSEVDVPKDKLLVFGDNRKASKDSREIGLVSINDIRYYLPYKEQKKEYQGRWRDSSGDAINLSNSILNVEKYVSLLNIKRKENSLSPLKYEPLLTVSANLRAQKMLSFDDFSFDGAVSKYSMKQAVADAGYSNIIYGEYPVTGYYDEKELIDYVFEFQESKKFLLNKDYQDIGISTFVGELNGCPTQIVVQHLAGYVPPNYKDEEIKGWATVLERLNEVKDSWLKIKDSSDFYNKNKEKVDRINEIIATRISNIDGIVKRMKDNQWLTKEQVDYTYKDEDLYKEQQDLAKKLNAG